MPYASHAESVCVIANAGPHDSPQGQPVCSQDPGMRIKRWSLVAAGLTAVTVGIFVMGGDRLPLTWRSLAPPGGLLAGITGEPPWPVLDRYCVACHNEIDLAGGFSFEKLDRNDFHGNAEVWEAAVRKLRTGFMPPMGEPRPERAVLDGMALSFEQELDAAWLRAPNPGAKPLARLNRTEYANAVRDLLAYDGKAIATALPPDVAVGGFDNIAAALSVSPTLLEGYAAAAMQIGRRAVGDRTMGHGEVRYTATGGTAQQRHDRGLATRHARRHCRRAHLPAGRRVRIRRVGSAAGGRLAKPDRANGLVQRTDAGHHVQRRALPVEDPRRFRLRVPAGPQHVTVALVDEERCAGVNELYLGEVALGGAVQGLTINGPFNATGPAIRRAGARFSSAIPTRQRRRRHVQSGSSRASRRARIAVPLKPAATSSPSCCSSTDSDAKRAVISRSASNTRCRECSWIRVSSIDSSASPPSSRSATSIASRTGARVAAVVFPLEQHSRRGVARLSPRRIGSAIPKCSPGRWSGCSRTSDRPRSSRISRASGCCCVSSTR